MVRPAQKLAALAFGPVSWFLAVATGFVVALLPVERLALPVFQWWDKAQHALGFAVLTAWAMWLWPLRVRSVMPGMLFYGAAIEVAQWVVGWRHAEWTDLLADAAGIWLAWVIAGYARGFTCEGRGRS